MFEKILYSIYVVNGNDRNRKKNIITVFKRYIKNKKKSTVIHNYAHYKLFSNPSCY